LIDSVCLGNENNIDLRALSYMLGCYRFHPDSLANALAICELELFLSITERPTIVMPTAGPSNNRYTMISAFWNARAYAAPTVVTIDSFPARKEHPNQQDDFVELTAVAARPATAARSGMPSKSNLRSSRLMAEMRQIASSEHSTYDVYISESDMTFWKVVMSGPPSPYENGTFML